MDFLAGLSAAQQQQVLAELISKNMGVPVGAPTNVPNFQMLGNTPKFNPYLLSNEGIMKAAQGGALVPKASTGLPAVIEGAFSEVPKAAAATAEAAPAATRAGIGARAAGLASKAGNIAGKTAVGRAAMSPLGLLGLAGGTAMYNDPGSGGFDPFFGIDPNDQPDDLGLTSLGKSMLRGTADTGNKIAGAASTAVDTVGEYSPFSALQWLFSPQSAREGTNTGAPAESLPGGAVELTGAIGEPAYDGASAMPAGGASGLPDYIMPQGIEVTPEYDALLKVLEAAKPKEPGDQSALKRDLALHNFAKMIAGNDDGSFLTGLAQGYAATSGADLQGRMAEAEAMQEYNKQLIDWAKEYAKTSIDIAEAKKKDSDIKIHSTRGGFLVQMKENGKTVLKPISADIFGTSGGKAKKMEILGSKFTSDNPLSGELGVLQRMADVGILNDVLVENQEALGKAAIGLTDAKQIREAQLLALARAMKANPNAKAAMMQKYVQAVGTTPKVGARFEDLEKTPPPAEGEADWLTQLSEGK